LRLASGAASTPSPRPEARRFVSVSASSIGLQPASSPTEEPERGLQPKPLAQSVPSSAGLARQPCGQCLTPQVLAMLMAPFLKCFEFEHDSSLACVPVNPEVTVCLRSRGCSFHSIGLDGCRAGWPEEPTVRQLVLKNAPLGRLSVPDCLRGGRVTPRRREASAEE